VTMRDNPALHIISLGAGVQSTTMALMAAHGEIAPMPDAAIFADTGAEPRAVYEHLAWMMSGNVIPFQIIVVKNKKGLKEEILGTSKGQNRNDGRPPFFVLADDGSRGILRRQCTQDYKIDPIRREVRKMLVARGLKIRPCVVSQWVGISLDEAHRMAPSRVRYIETRWPLIDARMSRRDCLRWLEKNGYPRPPRSACTFCPFRRDHEWRDMRDNDPDAWFEAVAVDTAIRSTDYRRLVGESYVHRSCVPLNDVDLSTEEERGQPDLFGNDCTGMCGT